MRGRGFDPGQKDPEEFVFFVLSAYDAVRLSLSVAMTGKDPHRFRTLSQVDGAGWLTFSTPKGAYDTGCRSELFLQRAPETQRHSP